MAIGFGQQSVPPVTRNLLIINGLFWLAQMSLHRIGIDLVGLLGMHYIESDTFRLHQLITYMFLHSEGSISHLFFNMFSVWMFGSTIERYWGSQRYLFFYITTGLTAALAQQALWYYELHPLMESFAALIANNAVTIGASGAVFGLLLAFGMLFPNAPMYLMFVPIPIKAKYFVIGYGLIELFLGVRISGDGIAHFAHLGGMIGGIILILLWRRRGDIGGPYY